HLPADDMLGFVCIPADPEFKIGTRRADAKRVAGIIGAGVPDREINDAPTPTPEFYIARYPVTVAQFRAFVEAKGVEIGDADALRDPDSRPVRWVSWHGAREYCDWLNDQLAISPVFAQSEIARLAREGQWRVALPSELEWEKAARGGLRDKIFSWDDEPNPNLANYADTKLGDTCAVGCFPQNGFGLHDMIGNVWEWTRSLYLAYPYKPDDGKREDLEAGNDVLRVVRGGSWYLNRDYARCAFRLRLQPDDRSDDFGFRVVVRSAPVR
ncbi:MAG: formylglycine-generating enzyme family protein, partial [Opitutaceae bacterium]